MDSRRENMKDLALWGKAPARWADIGAFLWGQTEDWLLTELLSGLMLIDREREWPRLGQVDSNEALPLPRAYALLKLLFLAGPLRLPGRAEPVAIAPEPEVFGQLRAGDLGQAVRLAARRLRASGLTPMCEEGGSGLGEGETSRLWAALLFPIGRAEDLASLVIRPHENEER